MNTGPLTANVYPDKPRMGLSFYCYEIGHRNEGGRFEVDVVSGFRFTTPDAAAHAAVKELPKIEDAYRNHRLRLARRRIQAMSGSAA